MSLSSSFDRDISRRIKDLREALNLSAEDLAERLEAPVADILAFETGEREVPVSYLYALAKATGVDLTALITGSEAKLHQYCLVKKGEGLSVNRRKAYKYQSLAYRFSRPSMEPLLVTVPPRGKDELDFNQHAGEEFIYLLEGRMEVVLGKEAVVLAPHDSLYFSSTIPHAMRALDGKDAVFLDVINFEEPEMQSDFKRYDTFEEFAAQFRMDVPANYNFAFDFLDEAAKITPDRPAMRHIGPDGARRDFDLAFFSSQSSRLANAFKAQGIARGDKVLIVLQRRVEFWVTVLALHKLGAVSVPSPHLLTAHDVEFRVNKAGITACVVEEDFVERLEAIKASCPTLGVLVRVGVTPVAEGWHAYEDILAGADEAFPRPADAAGGPDVAIVFFSSGTTGMPKMVVHNHTYSLGHFVSGVYWHDLRPGDVHLTVADTGWAKAFWGKFFGQWMAGACVFVWDYRGKFVPAELLDVICKHGVTVFCAPPTIYRFIIREDLSKFDLSKLRHCTTAGELLNEGVFHAWKKATGLTIYEGYGQTETTLQIGAFPNMVIKPGSIGKPSPGWDIELLNVKDQPCKPGEEGEICVRLGDGKTLGLFQGYLYEPEKTASVMFGGYYHTGDKAWRDEDGYYWFLGRNDDLIKSSGYRIGPFEVESALITHPAVIEAAVTGVPDAERGQAVKATLVLAPGYEPSPELVKEIQNHVKSVTAPYKYPRVVEFLPELPKTISGKIKRAEIRAKDESKGEPFA